MVLSSEPTQVVVVFGIALALNLVIRTMILITVFLASAADCVTTPALSALSATRRYLITQRRSRQSVVVSPPGNQKWQAASVTSKVSKPSQASV